MTRFLAFLRGLFPRFFPPPVVRWEDGERVRDPYVLARYEKLYADTVERTRALRPDAIQTPEMRVTVRIYDRFPAPNENGIGKVLAPNVIAGDTGGTLCLRRGAVDGIIRHEMKHAITGIPDHPIWLFGGEN